MKELTDPSRVQPIKRDGHFDHYAVHPVVLTSGQLRIGKLPTSTPTPTPTQTSCKEMLADAWKHGCLHYLVKRVPQASKV